MPRNPRNTSGLHAFCVLLGAVVLAAAGAEAREYRESSSVQRMTPGELLSNLIAGTGPVVIDARGTRFYDEGHVPGALDIHSKLIWGWVPDLEKYEDRGFVVYCDNGLNSGRAARRLLRENFRKVFVMEGHFKRWKKLGYPVEVSPPE